MNVEPLENKTLASLTARFIVVYAAAEPACYELRIINNVPHIKELRWHIIDRGPTFVLWDESTVRETIVGRYASEHEASRVWRLLCGKND